MCVEIIRYNVCNHEGRRFLKNCKFVRNAGCFEPICAYFFGERGPNPCQFPKVPGQVHIVEGWCSDLCWARNGDPRTHGSMGVPPSVYRREQRMTAAGGGEGNGYCLPAPETHSYLHKQKVCPETDDEVAEPQGMPRNWPFGDRASGERIAPTLEVKPQPLHNASQQTQDKYTGGLVRDNRLNGVLAKPEAKSSHGVPTSHSRREGPHRPLVETFDVTQPCWSERSSTVTRPLSEMYRMIQEDPAESDAVQKQGNEIQKSKQNKNKKKKRKESRKESNIAAHNLKR